MTKFTCAIKTEKYSYNPKKNNYSRIWYNYELDRLIISDKEVTLISDSENQKYDYCNLSKYSNTSYILLSFKIVLFDDKYKTYLFLKEFNCVPLKYSNSLPININKYWFIKPKWGTQGKGITITNKPDEKYQLLLANSTLEKYMIEECIDMNLINKHRWDIRIYVFHMINSNGELSTYLYNNGLVRLCPDIFDNDNISKRNMCSNTSLYKETDNGKNLNFPLSNIDNYDIILNNFKILLSKIHQKMKNTLKHNNRFILETQLLGYDVIIDKNNKIYIIEINRYPQYITKNNTPEIKNMKKDLIKDVYSLIKSYYLNKTIETNFILI